MPENNETKTPKINKSKKRLIATIIRWFFGTLFAVLLILAIAFGAVWKIIVLFAILTAGLTLLPRLYRKWFYACLGVTVLALIIWVFLPDDNQGWKPYTFDEEIAALNAKYAIPDEQNAALIYEKLLTNYDPNAFIPPFFDEDLDSHVSRYPWKSEDYPELTKWFEDKNEIINTLLDATEKKRCMFPISATFLSEEQMDRNVAMRRWLKLLVISGNNDMGEGRYQRGLEKYIAALKMGNHASLQIACIDVLIGLGIEAQAIGQLKRFVILDTATTKDLLVIEKNLKVLEHDLDSDVTRFLDFDRMLMKNMFVMMYEVNEEGKVRISCDPARMIRETIDEEVPPLTYWQKHFAKISTLTGQLFMPRTPTELNTMIDSAYEQLRTELPLSQKQNEDIETFNLLSVKFNFPYMIEMLTRLSLKVYVNIGDVYHIAAMQKKGLLLLISLRQHKDSTGHYPDSLSEIAELIEPDILVDPLNGQEFAYILTNDTFKLYSKGRNGIDEGGKFKWDPNIINDDRLIWPPRLSSNQEEGTDPNDEE